MPQRHNYMKCLCLCGWRKEAKMLTTFSLLKRLTVLFLLPCAIFLLPTFFYVIIVLSVGKIMHLCSRVYCFRYKIF